MNLYSQNNEQTYILEAFAEKSDGRFLDIGAYDAKLLSNTRALYERGWSGVMVEPSPGPMKVPDDRLRSVLGITTVAVKHGTQPLAITDSDLTKI